MAGTISPTDKVFLPESPHYEQLRKAFINANVPAKYPREIHRPVCVHDVIDAVNRAKELGIPIGVRSGGHLFTCMSLWQDGLLIDTSNLNRQVEYDEKTQTITYGPAVRVCEISEKLEKLGRFFPHGHAPSVAMGGFSLAGGQGFFMRGWGATVDQWVTELEVVVPDGSLIRANANENSDVFWAARGSGQGFFGVVTKFCARTIPARKFYQRQRTFAIGPNGKLFNEVLTLAIEQNEKTPKYGTEVAVCTFFPEKFNPTIEGDEISDPSSLMMSITAAAYVDSIAEAETLLSAFDYVPDGLAKVVVGPAPVILKSWKEVFQEQDMLVPYGNGEIWHIDSILNDPSIPLPEVR
ncbi:hypothetical protein VE00_09990 [Pseudogymnoascus sp. WSF 3629]|nr:hypothetical protein VE00_09990 [Pseudogymnoascus sp. WSF 3629]